MNFSLVIFPIIYAILEIFFFTFTPLIASYLNETEIDNYTFESILITSYSFLIYIFSYVLGILIYYHKKTKKNFVNYIEVNNFIILIIAVATLIYIYSFNIFENINNIRSVSFNRENKGYLYVFYWNIIFIGIILLLNKIKSIYIIVIFMPLLYITGSKKAFILLLLIILFDKISKLEGKKSIIILTLLSVPFSFYLFSGVEINEVSSYMINYFDHQIRGGQFLYMMQTYNFNLLNLMDQYWAYLPRFIFNDKPFIYGDLHLIDLISESSLYDGYAPAIPSWGYLYAVYGLPLILFFDLLSGLITSFLIYMTDFKNNIYAKILSMQLIFGIFIYPSRSHLFLFLIMAFIFLLVKSKNSYVQ
jgi:hypothetical protein